MKPELAKWDTDFFHYKVGKISVNNEKELNKKELSENDFKLIYIMCREELTKSFLNELNLKLADEKIILKKNIREKYIQDADDNIRPVTTLDNNLLNLTWQSGHYSRFKLDSNFVDNEFENLYKIWIGNSLKGEKSSKVFGFYDKKKLLGFITLSIKDGFVDIVLIAVDLQFRGLKIGKKLLNYADNYALRNGFYDISVSAQGANKRALSFYLKNDFTIHENIYIYHLWK